MEKRLGYLLKITGFIGIAIAILGLIEVILGSSKPYEAQTFINHLAGALNFNGTDTIMVGIWIIIATPVFGVAYVLVESIKKKNMRLFGICILILAILVTAILMGE